MDSNLEHIKAEVYDKCGLEMSGSNREAESREYDACSFQLNGRTVLYRSAKTTHKKAGQFVTFWKRSESGPIEPFSDTDEIDFFVVTVWLANKIGQFVFPKAILIQKGIISIEKKEGKRAFRVYPSWDITQSKQAQQTQKWQLNYFYAVDLSTDLTKVKGLFGVN
ncbi:MAG: hypothetical protein ACJAT1_000653 [Marivirga sp.]|jgi:hypothetical protein